MKSIAAMEGINSIVLDPSKNKATEVGDADPAVILRKLRKCRRSAAFVSIGPAKEEKKDEKKDNVPPLPKTCQRCDVWYCDRGGQLRLLSHFVIFHGCLL